MVLGDLAGDHAHGWRCGRSPVVVDGGPRAGALATLRNVPSFRSPWAHGEVPGFGEVRYDLPSAGTSTPSTSNWSHSACRSTRRPVTACSTPDCPSWTPSTRRICRRTRRIRPSPCRHRHLAARGSTLGTPGTPWRSTTGRFDRSPCGTGTSADGWRELGHRGELGLGQDFLNESFPRSAVHWASGGGETAGRPRRSRRSPAGLITGTAQYHADLEIRSPPGSRCNDVR